MAEKIDYQPTDAEAVVLLSGTADATARAGAAGGALGGGDAGAAGGSRGGRAGARLTRAHTAGCVVVVDRHPADVRDAARAAITASGTVIDDPNDAGDGSVWGLVASGFGNLVPALVRVQVDAAADGRGSRAEIRATGREGLIKQKIGAKAADRIAQRLSQL